MEDKEKILQLLKSDDRNNRKLGFILAKGLKYNLVKLLMEAVKLTNDDDNSRKEYDIDKYKFYLFKDSHSAIWDFKTDNYTWVDYEQVANTSCIRIKDCKKHFIKLILEDE